MNLPYLLEVSLCLGIFYAFYYLLMASDTFFQRNRIYLIISGLCAFALPLADSWIPNEVVEVSVVQNLRAVVPSLDLGSDAVKSAPVFGFTFWQLVLSIYWLVVLVLISRFILRVRTISQFIKNHSVQTKRGYYLVHTEGKLPTFSFFNYLFWDNTKQLDEADKERILAHELKHIWDRHSYDNLLFEVLKIILWFNPLIYLQARSLQLQHEFIADAAALQESEQTQYRQLLVRNLFDKLNLNLAQSFNQKEVRKRLAMMKQVRSTSEQHQKMLLLLPLFVILSFAFATNPPLPPKIEEVPVETLKTRTPEVKNRFATPEAGLDAFYEALAAQMQRPKGLDLEGRVIIQFTVNKDGSLDDYKVVKSLTPEYDKAAIDAIKRCKLKWLPAKVDEQVVLQQVTVPFSFKAE